MPDRPVVTLPSVRPTSGGSLDPFRFDRSWVFAVTPEHFWAVVSRTEDFRTWWPWLREFDGVLDEGAEVSCVVRSPLPYSLRFSVHVGELTPARLIRADVRGDLHGAATLELSPHEGGVEVRLAWQVELRRRLLRGAAAVVRPAMEWGHDWVVATGVTQFERNALGVSTRYDNP